MSKTRLARKQQNRTEKRNQRVQHKAIYWGVGGALGVALLLFLLLWGSGGISTMSDFTATTLNGDDIHLVDYRGQVVLLNFWATWCPPCRAEMPAIQAAYAARQQEGFSVLAINNAETPAQIRPFVGALGLSFPVVLDQDARLQRHFSITGYPTSIFVDAEGEIYATHFGMLTEAALDAYIHQGLQRTTTNG